MTATKSFRALVLVLSVSASIPALSHSGGLDAKGCHTNRKSGEYHCHRAQAAPEQKVADAADPSTGSSGVVKMSKSGICHDSSSPWYEQTKSYTPYDSMSACLRAGGRLSGQ